jgi:hypothetical protein
MALAPTLHREVRRGASVGPKAGANGGVPVRIFNQVNEYCKGREHSLNSEKQEIFFNLLTKDKPNGLPVSESKSGSLIVNAQ